MGWVGGLGGKEKVRYHGLEKREMGCRMFDTTANWMDILTGSGVQVLGSGLREGTFFYTFFWGGGTFYVLLYLYPFIPYLEDMLDRKSYMRIGE